MISHKHKCIFIHIPKCAGTSIEKALGHFDDYSGRGRQDHRSIRMIEPPNLYLFKSKENIREIIKKIYLNMLTPKNPKNRYIVSKKEYKDYFKFTIVRNPWARAYSWYNNVLRDPAWRKKYRISDDITLYDFLRRYFNTYGLRPQTFWIKNFKGDIPLDFIGRFENLRDDFNHACNIMNINSIELPHELKGSCNTYQNMYDYKAKKLIMNVFKEEIELFNYSFDR